jgi:hypothetical protein
VVLLGEGSLVSACPPRPAPEKETRVRGLLMARKQLTRTKALRLLSVCLLCRSVRSFHLRDNNRQVQRAGKRPAGQPAMSKGETMTRFPSLKSAGGLLRQASAK